MPSTAAISPAWTLQSLDVAAVGRLHDLAFLQQLTATPNLQARAGVIPSVGTSGNAAPIDLLPIQSGSPGMSVQIYPGNAVVAGSGRGPYVCGSTAAQTLTVATSNPTNPRIDVVYVQVLDQAAGDASTATQVGIVTGTPAGTPVAPALPATGVCIPLAQILVPANATQILNSNITDTRKSAGIGRGPRFLLGGDVLTDPGYCYGETRQRLLTTYLSNGTYTVVTDKWGFDSAWHGTDRLLIAKPTQTGSGSLGATATATIAQVTIPDPGWPYHIITGGMVDFGATNAARGLLCSINVDSTVVNTNAITQGHGTSVAAGVGSDVNANLATECSNLLTPNGYTGSHVLSFVAKNTDSASMTIYNGPSGNGGDPYAWLIEIVPA